MASAYARTCAPARACSRCSADIRMLVPRPPSSTTTPTPMIMVATSSSIRVSPRSSRNAERTSDLDLVEDAVHGRHQRDGHEAHHQPHRHDDQWLDQRDQILDLVVQLALVVAGGE